MTPRRPDSTSPRRSPGTPLNIAASLALSACLLGSGAIAANADEGTAPAAETSTAQQTPAVAAVPQTSTPATASPAPAPQDAAPAAPAAPAQAPVPAPAASTPATATPAPRAPTTASTSTPLAPGAATAPDAAATATASAAPSASVASTSTSTTANEPAAATETPVSTPQQQPTPPATAAATAGVTSTVQGTLDLAPGEKPKVGTAVRWVITLHNTTIDTVRVQKTLVRIAPGESAEVEDNRPGTRLTQADLDAGHVRYLSKYDVGPEKGTQTVLVEGDLRLPTTTSMATPTTEPTAPTSTTPTSTPATATSAADRVTATVRGSFSSKPGEPVTVGTKVNWIVTFHHTTPDRVAVSGTTLDLAPGRSGYVEDTTQQTTITRADLDAGVVTYRNAFGIDTPAGSYSIPATGEIRLPAPSPASTAAEHPALTATTRGELELKSGERVKVGTRVKWTTTLTNTGDVPLHDVHAELSEDSIRLEAGGTADITFFTTIKTDNLVDGLTVDASRVSGLSPAGTGVSVLAKGSLALPDRNERVFVDSIGRFVLQPGEPVKANTRVKWIITVTNATDSDILGAFAENDGDRSERLDVIAAGGTAQLHLETTVTEQDLASGVTGLLADVVGRTAGGPVITTTKGELEIQGEHPSIEGSFTGALDLEPGRPVAVGTEIAWTITLANTGDVALGAVGITAPIEVAKGRAFDRITVTDPSGLAAGRTKVYHVIDTVTQKDLDAGAVHRQVAVRGDLPNGSTYIAAPILGTLPLPAGTSGATAGVETGTAVTAHAASNPAPESGGATVDGSIPAREGSLQRAVDAAARSSAGAATASVPASASRASDSTSAKSSGTKRASAAHLAQTGVDAASALPAAGILGLLGALGLLLGARRRRGTHAAD